MSKRSEWKPRTKPANHVSVAYVAKEFSGTGDLLDLSEEGLKIRGTHTVHAGLQVGIQINATDSAISLHIARAHVRWSKGREFGVKFDALEPAVKTQLLAFLATLAAPITVLKSL
ncbi:PilZ domain-containing protein [Petrachloros mirabilis]